MPVSRIALIPLRSRSGETVAHAIIDAADEAEVNQWRWCLNPNGYAWRSVRGGREHVYLHRMLGGCTAGDGLYVDHINRDRLDCRRENLRQVTPAESAQNKSAISGRFRGVRWDPLRRRWLAQAQLDGRHYHLGRHLTEEAAAAVVEAWRREHMPFSEEAAS